MADEFKGSACYTAAANAAKAAGEELSERDMAAAYRAAQQERQKLRDAGVADGVDEKVRAAAERLAERTRIAAALQKRHAALNIIARDRLDQTLEAFKKAGLSPRNALLAVMEGTQQGVEGARNSVYARALGYEARYVGGMMSEIQKNRPHLADRRVLADQRMSDDVFREMGELRDGGNPGATGNDDAKYLASVFAKYAELSRTELNKLGASIGKLDGWAGAQVHDDLKMIQVGKDSWVETVAPLLDRSRTFPDAATEAEIRDILGDVYDTLITGVPNKASAREKGQRVGPANLAKSLGKTRVLHFKDAESALTYRDAFGYGNAIYGVMAHQRRAAQMAAQMEVFGPNPEVMFNSLVEAERRKIRNSDMDPAKKQKEIEKLNADVGPLRSAFDVMSGAISRPGNVKAAKIAGDIRAVQSMAKLGGAVLTAMPTDVVGAAQAAMFRGSGFFNGMVEQVGGMFRGRPKGEQAEIAYMMGEGFDSLIGEIMSRGMAADGPVGKLSRMQEAFFRWNGLNWWTDVGRSVVSRTVAAEMGMRAKTAFNDLPANYRHVLGLHSIGEAQWEAIRKAGVREINGKAYITPDNIRDLPDEVVAPLVSDRINQTEESSSARLQSLQSRVDQETQWVEGRRAKLNEWFGKTTSRLQEIKSSISERTGARSEELKSQIDALGERLSDIQEFYEIGEGSERTVARKEIRTENRIARSKKSLKSVLAWLDTEKASVDERTSKLIRNTVAQLDDLEAKIGGGSKLDQADASSMFDAMQTKIREAIDRSGAKKKSLSDAAKLKSDEITAKLDELSASLDDVRSAYPITKSQARQVGRDETRIAAKQREIGRRIRMLERNADKQQKAALEKFYKDWAERQVDLEEFAKRSQERASMFKQMSERETITLPERKAEIIGDARRDLELTLLRFVADETNYAIVETDAASRRISTFGTRPGTFAGEAARFVMQFKGFPVAFSQRILGRAIFGGRGANKWERAMNNAPHLGALMAGLTVAGYMAMTMKDAAKGYWPPRDPMDPKVITAALTQGGALGIYGDFLFGEANRFGSGALETFSGPFIGTLSDVINVPLKARSAIEKGERPKMAGDLLNLALNNTPFINLAYTRPALDILFINALKDWASPGYVNRQRRNRLKDYNQTSPLPATLSEALR